MGVDITGNCLDCGVHVETTGGCPACQNQPTGIRRARTPHGCPVCNGAGKVQRPPWIAGDQISWTAPAFDLYDCQACSGTGIVWEPIS